MGSSGRVKSKSKIKSRSRIRGGEEFPEVKERDWEQGGTGRVER